MPNVSRRPPRRRPSNGPDPVDYILIVAVVAFVFVFIAWLIIGSSRLAFYLTLIGLLIGYLLFMGWPRG